MTVETKFVRRPWATLLLGFACAVQPAGVFAQQQSAFGASPFVPDPFNPNGPNGSSRPGPSLVTSRSLVPARIGAVSSSLRKREGGRAGRIGTRLGGNNRPPRPSGDRRDDFEYVTRSYDAQH